MRQVQMRDYLSLVFYYLRGNFSAGASTRESLVPVVVHPSGLWKVIGRKPDEKNAASEQQEKKRIKAVNGLFAKASALSGAAQMAVIAEIRKDVGTHLNGRAFLSRKKATRPATYTNAFVLSRRQGLVVGNYLTYPHSSRRTLFHELGHYLGVAHVFTEDRTTETGCSRKFAYGDSYWTMFDGAAKQPETRKLMCDCFFVLKDGKDYFADYDGSVAATGDTPLAIYHENMVQYPQCGGLERYAKVFPGGSHDSEENLMTYPPARPNGWNEKAHLTPAQKQVARDMLKSFD
jgi:hypothetical protein